jgi:hypothetical protein
MLGDDVAKVHARPRMCAGMPVRMRACARTRESTRAHTRARTHTHSRTHARMQKAVKHIICSCPRERWQVVFFLKAMIKIHMNSWCICTRC